MRSLFVLLLIVNVGYAGWAVWQRQANVGPVSSQTTVPSVRAALANIPHQLKVVTAPVVADNSQPQALRAGAGCVLLGSWPTQQAAIKARQGLPVELGAPLTRKGVVHKSDLDWVYLPPFDSRRDAARVLKRLQAHQVDSFIVTGGDNANAISLGYFSDHELALRLKKRMAKVGYQVKIAPSSRDISVWWLQFDVDMIPELKHFLALHKGDAKLKLRACDKNV